MRLEKIQKVLKEKNFPYTYTEEDGCGSIDFEYRGANVRTVGRHEDILGDYEEEIIKLISGWK